VTTLERYTDLFPLWAVLLSIVAFLSPSTFAPMAPGITPLLGVVMLAMGLGLSGKDFALVVRRPRLVLSGVALQFLAMPLLAWLVARALRLSPELATGIILVGCCPGGTASNVITYLGKGDVALSISLTALSTLAAVVLTPLLATWYIGERAPVPTLGLLTSVVEVVLVPVTLGTLVNSFFGSRLGRVKRALPAVSVSAIVLIIAIIVALNEKAMGAVGGTVLLAVALHNALGLAAGYGAARLLGADRAATRTLMIEIGMQNSGLGVALAKEYFTLLSALPGAIFSVWHNLTGSLLAAVWARRDRA
jgi:BASS family bile acid:Na+ symporter